MITLRQKRRNLLNETKDFFNLTNRSTVGTEESCRYFHPTLPGCAIGRKIKDKRLCRRLDNGDFTGVTNENVFCELPKELQKLGMQFLGQVQDLHDTVSNWTDTGLSEKGQRAVKHIRNEFNL